MNDKMPLCLDCDTSVEEIEKDVYECPKCGFHVSLRVVEKDDHVEISLVREEGNVKNE